MKQKPPSQMISANKFELGVVIGAALGMVFNNIALGVGKC